MTQSLELLNDLLSDVESLSFGDNDNLDKVLRRTGMLTRKILQKSAPTYLKQLRNIRFKPVYSSDYRNTFYSGKQKLINLVEIMIEETSLSASEENLPQVEGKTYTNDIFLVHGHNEEMKQSTARFIEKIKLNPIILHEQPNKGRTIIEKFTEYSNVGFAIVLLSADDMGYLKDKAPEIAKLRARQNVILELGFFLGKIGRERVVVLHENADNFEFPSDYDGVLYVPYDNSGSWRNSIVRELKAVDYDIDANNLF